MLVTVLDDAFLADWCDRHLGARPACVLFRSGHLSEVVAAELADGRRVVIKARPSDPRIAGCTAVQEHLARAGFPCPEPLAVPVQAGWLTVTAEAFVSGGSQPDRDDRGRDLNSTPGPAWVDEAARGVRERLLAFAAPARIGHGDWESQNIRWTGGRPLAVHDWDSVLAQPEAAVVGLAAAVWPAAGAPGEAASVKQTGDFIASYQRAAGRQWTEPEIQNAWAAGLWVRLFNAKKDAAEGGGPQLGRLAGEIDDRLAQAAIADQDHHR